jgi:hypothetical protein
MPQLEAKRMRNSFADPAFRELASRRAKHAESKRPLEPALV